MGLKWIALGAAVLAGCIAPTTYGYQYRLTQQFSGGEEPELPAVEARQLLEKATTVAFYPPDSCLNADTNVVNRKLQELRANCGVLMSTLERAAQRAGYEVLSWQNLRGGRAIDFAREGKVDVLFEINEFQITALTEDSVERNLRFFEVHGDGNETPLMVASTVGGKCEAYAAKKTHQRTVAATGSIDIKTVEVADGRDRWHYRKTRERQFAGDFPKVTFTGKGKRHWAWRVLGGFGVASAAIAFDLWLLPELITDDPATPEDEGFDPSPWQYVTTLGALGFFGGAIAVHYKFPVKPAPDTLMCDDAHADPERYVVTAGTLSAEHSFTSQSHADLSKQDYEQIRDEMIGDFIKVLAEAHGAKR